MRQLITTVKVISLLQPSPGPDPPPPFTWSTIPPPCISAAPPLQALVDGDRSIGLELRLGARKANCSPSRARGELSRKLMRGGTLDDDKLSGAGCPDGTYTGGQRAAGESSVPSLCTPAWSSGKCTTVWRRSYSFLSYRITREFLRVIQILHRFETINFLLFHFVYQPYRPREVLIIRVPIII